MKKEDAGVLYSCDKVYEDVSDLLGQNIKVLAKVNTNETSVYGVYADEDSKVLATGFVGALELDGDKKVKLNGTSYKVDGDNYTADLVREANVDAFASGKQLDDLAAAAAKGTITPDTAASTIKLIDNNGNGKVDGAVLVPVQVAKVSAVSKTSLTLNFLTNGVANSTLKFDDADVYEGVAKNDYVTIVDDEFRSTSNSLVSKLDVVSADAAATRTNEVKVDGEWYKLAKDDTNTVISVTTGNTYDFVMVGGVVVNAEETAASSSNIAYISGIEEDDNGDNKLTTSIGETTGTLKVRMFFQDGTDKEVKVSKIDGEKIVESGAAADQAEASELTANKMYTYSELSDGTYDVKAVSADNEVGMDWVASPKQDSTASSTYYKQKIGGYAVADEAVVFVQTGKETKVLTGKQVKNWADDVTALDFTTANTQILTKSTNGIAYVKFAVLYATTSTNVPGASNDKLYAYLTADAYQATVDGEKKAAFDVWTGTENVTLYEDVSSHDSLKAGNVIEYSENGKFISDIDVVGKIVDGNLSGSTNMVAITGFNDKTVAYRYDNTKTEKNIDLADNCVFIAVNDDKNEGMEGSIDTVTMANEFVDENGKVYYVPNGYIVLNEDGDEIVAIIFDADNSELDVTYGKGDVDMLMEK